MAFGLPDALLVGRKGVRVLYFHARRARAAGRLRGGGGAAPGVGALVDRRELAVVGLFRLVSEIFPSHGRPHTRPPARRTPPGGPASQTAVAAQDATSASS
ncbi:hypothetical protein GCM10009546_21020 [Actinomadura livida]|uniref:Uncharacterized protein n=1 Tax=Actinomadura livida TaxID=79909 RepID=A0ABN1E4L5_9ACTN|nr:hypothetical protein GCM10010208_02880 [Actinomadura livida]